MRKLLFLPVILFLLAPISRGATTFYAQTAVGLANGADCADALALPASLAVSAGNIYMYCGTGTYAAGTSAAVTLTGGGASGNPAIFRFAHGAIMQAPYWGQNGAIRIAGNYITVDGSPTGTPCGRISGVVVPCDGTIQATANGASLANHVAGGKGVWINPGIGDTEQNLNILNLFVPGLSGNPNNETTAGAFSGNSMCVYADFTPQFLTVQNNVCTNAHSMVRWGYQGTAGNTNLIQHNVFNGTGEGVWIGAGNSGATIDSGGTISGIIDNDFSNLDFDTVAFTTANSSCAAGSNHQEFIHLYTQQTSSQIGTLGTPFQIAGNIFHGRTGCSFTSESYIECDSSAQCGAPNHLFVDNFNNTYVSEDPNSTLANNNGGNGMSECEGATCRYWNNTYYSNVGNGSSSNFAQHSEAGSIITLQNNIFDGMNAAFVNAGGTATANNNLGFGLASACGSPCNQSGNPLLNTGSVPPYQLTSTSSGAYQTGLNLFGTITALNSDALGVLRPSSGPWDMGAFEFAAGGTVILAPTTNNFGSFPVGLPSANFTFTLTNSTASALASLSFSDVGGNPAAFPLVAGGTCSTTLAAGSSCTHVRRFVPTAVGGQSTTLTATYSGGSQTAALSGTGLAPPNPTFNYAADDYGGLLTVPCPANPHAVSIMSASQSGTVQTVVVQSVANFAVNESMLISGTGTAMDWSYTANNATDGGSYITAINAGTNTLTLTAAAAHTVATITAGTLTPGRFYIQTIATPFGNGPQFCTPEKHWLWLTVVGAAGGAVYQGTGAVTVSFATKYGSACAGAQALETEFVNTLNFNTIGPDPDSTYALNGGCTTNTKLDTFTDVGVSQYSGVNLGGYVSQPLMDMNAAVDNFYNANGGINAPMVDYFNPNWRSFLSQFITKFNNNLTQFYRTPHFLGTPGDDTDFTKLPDAGGDFHTIPISHQSVDPAMQVLVTSPLMTLEAVPTANIYGGGQPTPYVFADPLNYSKTPVASPPPFCNVTSLCDLPDFLSREYATPSALNTAWSTSSFYTTFGSSGTCFGYGYSWCGAISPAGSFAGTAATTYTPALGSFVAPHSLQILLNGVPIGGDCPFFSALPGMGCSGATGTGNILGPGIWKASLAFPVGFVRTDSNGNIEIATVAGTSGASAPAWPAPPASTNCTGTQTTTDGTGTWKCLGPGISNSSTINYSTGAVSIVFNSALSAANTITLNYETCGWGCGTGLLDEDGRHTAWIGNNYVCEIQPPAFASSHVYSVNQEIHDASSGTWQIVTAAGTSGSAPAFSSTQGTPVATGTVTFTSMGLPVCGTEAGSDFGAINANQIFGADMETWLQQEAGAYFGGIQAAFHANYPDLLYGGADAVGVWNSVPRAGILIAAQQYSDWIYTASFSAPNIDLNAYAKNSFQTQYYQKPMVTYHTLVSTQSIYGCDGNPGPTICFSTQAAKGNQYFLNTQAQLNSALSYSGTFQWAGMQWWGSHPFQSADFGFNTSLDNLYDGNDNVNPSVACSPPLAAYPCGLENSGASWLGTNLTTSIAAANLLWTQGVAPPPAGSTCGAKCLVKNENREPHLRISNFDGR